MNDKECPLCGSQSISSGRVATAAVRARHERGLTCRVLREMREHPGPTTASELTQQLLNEGWEFKGSTPAQSQVSSVLNDLTHAHQVQRVSLGVFVGLSAA